MTHAIATLIRKTTSNGHRPSGKRQRVDRTSKRDRDLAKRLKVELIERVSHGELNLGNVYDSNSAIDKLVVISGQMLTQIEKVDPQQKLRIASRAVRNALKQERLHIVQRRRKFVACSTEDKRNYDALDALDNSNSRKFEDTALGKALTNKKGTRAA